MARSKLTHPFYGSSRSAYVKEIRALSNPLTTRWLISRAGWAFALLLLALPARAQTVAIGASGGTAFGNLFLGPTVEAKLPLGSHFELDDRDTFAPLELHTPFGHGYSNVATTEPAVWLNPAIGIDGRLDWSTYHVRHLAKNEAYAYGGLALRGNWLDAPVRLNLDYFHEVRNGVYRGLETSHLQGGSLYLEAQLGCSRHACYYTTLEFAAGTLLQQGNPMCDGSYDLYVRFRPLPCPRTRSLSGSGIMGFLVEFQHR